MRNWGLKIGLFLLFMFCGFGCQPVLAAPHFTLTPSTGSFTNGNNFTVTIAVDSGTEKSSALDVWGIFDSAKLEVVSIVKAANPAFSFELLQNIYNTTGKFDFSCTPTEMINFEDKVLTGDLVVVTFKAKSTGVASVAFSCTAGSTVDSNIFKASGIDVIDCTANQSGSYTIVAAAGTTTTVTTAPTPTTATTTTATTSTTTSSATATPTPTAVTQLPKAGGAASTLGLIVFGAVSVLGAFFLRIL